LNESEQKKMFRFFFKNDIKNFVGVPDPTMKYFINQAIRKKKIIIATREEEAIGIAVGMILSKNPTMVFMQNAGFANSLSTITSLVQLYQIPILFLIGWRGYQKNDAPEHTKIGKIQPQLIKSLQLESKIVDDKNWKECSKWALRKIKQNVPCALVIRRVFVD